MSIFLLQFRPDQAIADHEYDMILKFSGRPASDFVRVNALGEPLSSERLDVADAVILGGSGDYLVSRGDLPEIRAALKSFLTEARSRGIPLLGICFGGQLMTEAFGGRVELDLARAEVGTFPIEKTEEGDSDPLFAYLPKKFDAQLGHKDHFIVIPPGAVRLASSQRSPNQAWTFPGEPIYALTFHPELDVAGTLYRVDYYIEEYQVAGAIHAELVASLRESPEANELIARFLETFV